MIITNQARDVIMDDRGPNKRIELQLIDRLCSANHRPGDDHHKHNITMLRDDPMMIESNYNDGGMPEDRMINCSGRSIDDRLSISAPKPIISPDNPLIASKSGDDYVRNSTLIADSGSTSLLNHQESNIIKDGPIISGSAGGIDRDNHKPNYADDHCSISLSLSLSSSSNHQINSTNYNALRASVGNTGPNLSDSHGSVESIHSYFRDANQYIQPKSSVESSRRLKDQSLLSLDLTIATNPMIS
jgi:hypothetical protein